MESVFDKPIPVVHYMIIQSDLLQTCTYQGNPFNDNGKTRIFEVMKSDKDYVYAGSHSKKVMLAFKHEDVHNMILLSSLIILN